MGLSASRKRRITANTIRKMQVPAYCPSLVGVHVVVNRDERAEMKNVITMDVVSEDMPDMSDEEVEVDEGIDIADVVVMVMPDMSILAVVIYGFVECKCSMIESWKCRYYGRQCDGTGYKNNRNYFQLLVHHVNMLKSA
jgi:hypothetical protein